jgi:hypothetical protein
MNRSQNWHAHSTHWSISNSISYKGFLWQLIPPVDLLAAEMIYLQLQLPINPYLLFRRMIRYVNSHCEYSSVWHPRSSRLTILKLHLCKCKNKWIGWHPLPDTKDCSLLSSSPRNEKDQCYLQEPVLATRHRHTTELLASLYSIRIRLRTNSLTRTNRNSKPPFV